MRDGCCTDPDCLNPEECRGNRFEVDDLEGAEGEEAGVVYRAVHHKVGGLDINVLYQK
jgi:hypothetical protein